MNRPWFWPVVFVGLVGFALITLVFVYQQFNTPHSPDDQVGASTPDGPVECLIDADCMVAGCSATLCVARGSDAVVSTCEYRDEYGCFADDNCLCQNHVCQWEGTALFRDCVDRYQGTDCSALSPSEQIQCEGERSLDTSCDGLVGLDYIECRSSAAADTP